MTKGIRIGQKEAKVLLHYLQDEANYKWIDGLYEKEIENIYKRLRETQSRKNSFILDCWHWKREKIIERLIRKGTKEGD